MKKRLVCLLLASALLAGLSGFASANNTKLIALTFDDGPSASYTPGLLDGLSARGVKVTFFLVGRSVSYWPSVAAREAAEGHQLGSHTWSHAWLTKLSAADVQSEVSSGVSQITAATGSAGPFYLRAPYGAVNATVCANVGAPIILWSVDPGSGSMKASEASMDQTLLRTAFDGGIVILHDTSQKNVNVALYGIDQLRAQGYEFVTVEELFRLRGVTPQAGTVYYKVPQSAAETSFDETQLASHWACASIQAVEKAGIIAGTGGGFQPNAWLTRAQAAAILWRMAGAPAASGSADSDAPAATLPVASGSVSTPTSSAVSSPMAGTTAAESVSTGFADVPADAWYARAVAWAQENGCLFGSEGRFRPDQYITKQELYTMLARYGGEKLAALPQTASPAAYCDDARTAAWAAPSVALFRGAGFVSKNDRQIFRPKDFATRAETAELVSWLLARE